MTAGGALASSVTLEEVFAVVGTRRVPLAPELAGYLVLEIAEHADPNGGELDLKAVFVGEEGTVALVKPRREAGAGDSENSIRAVLARLLEASGSQTPALAAAGRRTSGAGLGALAEEIEAALIPVNRAAGRRALARLAREVKRVTLGVGRNALPSSGDSGPPPRRASAPSHAALGDPPPRPASSSFAHEEPTTTARGTVPEELLRRTMPTESGELSTTQFESARGTPSPSQADVDALIADFGVSGTGEHRHARDLKSMVGLEQTPGPPEKPPSLPARHFAGPAGGPATDTAIESLLAMGASPAPAPPLPQRANSERQLVTQPSRVKRGSLANTPRVGRPRMSGALVVLAMAATAVGAYAVSRLRPGPLAGRSPEALVLSAVRPPGQSPPPCKGTLVVSDVPAHAEVLLREGQAPVDVDKMPVGTRLEFVATAEGYAPKRVVVPAGATWDRGSDGQPRFEVAVQLDQSRAKNGNNDPWPAAEPGSEVGGQGPPGTVHVVGTPRGAEVWMLAGIGPEARIEQLRCDQSFDVLVAGPTTFQRRLRASASDFVPEETPGAPAAKVPVRVARISAK